jgi:alpha-L-fucosidase 2
MNTSQTINALALACVFFVAGARAQTPPTSPAQQPPPLPALERLPVDAGKNSLWSMPWQDRASVTGSPSRPDGKLNLWYRAPAAEWYEALPLGNGRLGAMLFGGVADECIQLNVDSLWDGGPKDVSNPAALKVLPEVRRLMFEGKNPEATKLACANMMGLPPRIKSYQTLGELYIEAPGVSTATDYLRSLDLETAVAKVSYQSGGVKFSREAFSSAPANVIAIRYTASKPGSITLRMTLKRAMDAHCAADPANPKAIQLIGQINRGKEPIPGVRFNASVLAQNEGGRVTNTGGILTVEGADSLTLLIAGATNYPGMGKGAPDPGLDPATSTAATLAKVPAYAKLRSDHISDYQTYFSRVSLDLGADSPDVENLPTHERLKRFKTLKTNQSDPGLVALYFQYGRYLLISCSRPGSLPANLQGIWAWKINNIWSSDFHTNVNVQMNYWMAEQTNLAELHLPLFDLMDSLVGPGTQTAKVQYDANGWVVHHLTDAWGYTACANGVWAIWPMGAAWLARHPWEHYQYTGDTAFLKNRAWPLMKGAARFILDILVVAPAGSPVAGKLVTNPSYSPENHFILADGKTEGSLSYGVTMDLQIIQDLLSNCIDASKILKIDPEFRKECEIALAKLAPMRISPATGRIMEWIEDYKERDPRHRHTSHLYGLHPANSITKATPDFYQAARKVLEGRGDGGTGWSMAWKINMWARLGDGDHAYLLLTNLLKKCTLPNLFDTHAPFQIDGNFGATAAVTEMLVQSQIRMGGKEPIPYRQEFQIDLLPALPSAWPTGRVVGLRARGGFTVDLDWKDGKLVAARVLSTLGGPLHLRLGDKIASFETKPGQSIVVDGSLAAKRLQQK